MAKRGYSDKGNYHQRSTSLEIIKSGPPKKVTKRLVITSQTAHHITELALRENISEGKVIDKLMRTYLATQKYRP